MPPQSFGAVGSTLARVGRGFYARGWALGTSGNFSVVMSHRPLRLAITRSGVSKREPRREIPGRRFPPRNSTRRSLDRRRGQNWIIENSAQPQRHF